MDHDKFISMNYIKVVEKHALYSKTECCSKHDYNMLETPPMLIKSHHGLVLVAMGIQECMYIILSTLFPKRHRPKIFQARTDGVAIRLVA